MAEKAQTQKQQGFTEKAIKTIVLILFALLVFSALVLPDLMNQQTQMVSIGEVSTQEILAPYSVTFESRIYTDSAKESAASEVQAVYLPPDPDIARTQLQTLENSLYYMSTIRSDSFSNETQKIQDFKGNLLSSTYR